MQTENIIAQINTAQLLQINKGINMRKVSFECFPARDEVKMNSLTRVVEALSQFQPEFVSITYGAAGSSQKESLATISTLQEAACVPVAGHVTFAGQSREDALHYCATLWAQGIRHLIVLRGDPRESKASEDQTFSSVSDFIKAIKAEYDFEIGVACYPEVHPKAQNFEADLAALKEKQDAGADFAITQFFFENDVFAHFVQAARKAGITLPLIPGILPIYNLENCINFAQNCGSSVPNSVLKAFAEGRKNGLKDSDIAAALLERQARDLAERGYEHIHIYALNRLSLSKIAAGGFLGENNNFARPVAN